MQCAEAREQLGAYLDGELDPEWQGVVLRHVESCPRCEADLQALRETIAAVRTLGTAEPPVGLRERIRARIEALPAHGTRWTRVWRLTPVRAAATVAAALAVLIGLGLLREPAPEPMRPIAADLPAVPFGSPPSGTQPVSTGERVPTVVPAAPRGPEAAVAQPEPQPLPAERRVAKRASMVVESREFERAVTRIEAIVAGVGGFVERATTAGGEPRSAMLVLRVPVERFDATLSQIEQVGSVRGREVAGQDVTEEFVDVGARLRNALAQEARLREMYARSARISELLQIEARLAEVREEIERYEARIRVLALLTDLGRIEIDLREERRSDAPPSWHPRELGRRLLAAIAATLDRIGNAAASGLVVVASVLPYGVLGGAGWAVVGRLRRPRRTLTL